MVFSAPIFLFGFLPLFLGAYYTLPRAIRPWLLLLASYGFYGWWRIEYLGVIFGISMISFIAGKFATEGPSAGVRSWAVRIGVALDLLILGYFKYAYFFAQNLSAALDELGHQGFGIEAIILPIGISFLTFQSISYILDVARKDAPPASSLVDFLSFSALFPQLIAGPVLRYKDLAAQFVQREHSVDIFAAGIKRFVTGLAMKLLVADTIAPLADRMFALEAPTMAEAWLGGLAFSIQLFFDFAGYSAMAIGLGLMIGFRFVENFNAPYSSRSITEFWQRWHISLSNWLRDYLYIPLGGNRGGKLRTYRNLLLTMILGGFWHGANWTFLLWGAWHGGLMALERALGAKQKASPWPRVIAWPLTMTLVLIGWVMFRATTVAEALRMYGGMVGHNGVHLSSESLFLNQPTEYIALTIGCGFCAIGGSLKAVTETLHPSLATAPTILLFASCSVVLNARAHSPFLYFQF